MHTGFFDVIYYSTNAPWRLLCHETLPFTLSENRLRGLHTSAPLSGCLFIVFKPALSSLPVFARFERKLPIYCVDTDKPQVAISFDAAWGNEDTETLLSILAKYNVKTTFFMTGGWIESYPEDVKKIAAAGHDLGNHSENHKQMSQLSSDDCIAEIQKPHDKVKELTGTEMTLFRPPYGDYNNTLIESANVSRLPCDPMVCG